MGFHQIKKILYIKGNSYQIDTSYRMGENIF
jgi:hypothetical protein